MKQFVLNRFTGVMAIGFVALASATIASAQTTNNVTGGDFVDYTINGQHDPTFILQRGVTYVFQLSNVSIHPFWIKTPPGGIGSTGAFNTGVVNNGGTSGSVVFTVPASAPNSLIYQCGNHGSMQGNLTIVDPPVAPPTVRIVYITVGPNVVVTSTGTNGWSAIPEFKCDITSTNWTAVSPFTNSFANGTNTTSFNRLESICGSPAVFLRIRNQKN